MGLMDGSIGIGAPFDGLLDQVERLVGCGRALAEAVSFMVCACTGNGRGATFSLPEFGWDEAVEFSDRPIKDFLNHDGFDEVEVSVEKSLDPR
jgi:hypothetical protein